MSDEGIRLAKRVADTVSCSRGEAERYIAGGWVSVDGDVVEDPATRVLPEQVVALLPGAQPADPAPVTILLHKPAGLTMEAALASLGPDTLAQAGPGVRFLRRHLKGLTAELLLEPGASGLVVFTQDWRVARKLGEADRIEQEYVAELADVPSAEALDSLVRAAAPGFKVSRQSEARLRCAGKAIRPGQIAALCETHGLALAALRRLRLGRVALGPLPAGRWRYLGEFERF